MHIEFVDRISDIGATAWNAVCGVDYPFLRYEFLHALEETGACSKETGWQPCHAVVYESSETKDPNQLLALMPLYIKYHSYGEYIFDWAWADTYRRSGIDYYPKLLSAIPYSPVTGPRLTFSGKLDSEKKSSIVNAISHACIEHCQQINCSSLHILYSELAAAKQLATVGLPLRHSYQYHWQNHNYQHFDNFLDDLKSRKRKDIRKEREQVQRSGLTIRQLSGCDLTDDLWETFHTFYQLTYAKRSGHGGYLPKSFFLQLAKTMPEQMLLVIAERNDASGNGEIVAGALNFYSSDTLYGRYWGCIEELEFLHFELCYYQGIDFCIQNQLQRFDAGAQGEHKIQRGFRPVTTWSNHWIAHPQFRDAIAQYLNQEADNVRDYINEAEQTLPFANRA